ncbi:site-specific recombinase XerD [Kibdelosporangium banguiense]|uniref:Site-specific recombinase XerD n=1 Tax=Kibdelosporangium banguiense TaxID=1365924 RepID=A0ABS4TJX9_9PSEU|nr:tyrosine-type recombinase/integrase [Kibdelosporangium banguiense]MBP2324721.1 site-specific recombinase XerD [Kibdelosporangium banguiense]
MKQRRVMGIAGPLALYANGFQAELECQGYAPDSVRWRLRQLRALSRWLHENRLTAADLNAECVTGLVSARRANGLVTLVSAANFALVVDYLREIGAVPPDESARTDPVECLLEQYRGYLVSERGLASGSVSVNLRVAERFCRDVQSRHHRLEDLSAGEVTAYAEAVCARSSVGWSKKTMTALASLLRFLHVTGVIGDALGTTLPKVAGHRRSLARELTDADVGRLLAGCDRQRLVGLRDHAIVIVLWRLGLRAGEVAALTVDEVDWHRGEVTVCGKGNRYEVLPLPADVGAAVVAYLRDDRRRVPPRCRALFTSVRAPEGTMTAGGVCDVVTRLAGRAGMPATGPHLLRHGAAAHLLRHGSSWTDVAQVLRHRNVGVTACYATVDPTTATELARPWPGAR